MIQKKYFGIGSIRKIKHIVSKQNPRNIFLVTGKKSYETCGAKKIIDELLSNYNLIHFDDFEENPKLEDITKGANLYKENNIDLVIAIGGGSVIDMAKLINILSHQEKKPKDYILKVEKIKKRGKDLIVIPTTAGTGSEATNFAVVYIKKNKYSLENDRMLPNTVIIDPQLTFCLPSDITANSGIDAFCQAVESYWCINSTKESKKYSKRAIKIILDNLVEAVNKPSIKSRIEMSKAAYLSGKAINITKTTAPHAISYPLTSYFHIRHGQAVALTLPEFLVYNYYTSEKDIVDNRGVEYVKRTICELNNLFGCDNVYKSRYKLLNFIKKIKLFNHLSTFKIREGRDIDLILDNINIERLENNPRIVTKKVIKNMLVILI